MTYSVIIQPQAEADIEAAYLWKHDNAPQAAARWFVGIVEAINALDQFPARCPLAPENEHFPQEIRQLLYGPRNAVSQCGMKARMRALNMQKMTNRRRYLNDIQTRKISSHSAHISSARNPKNYMRLPLPESDAGEG